MPVDGPSSSERTSLRDRRLAGDEEQRLLANLKACGTYFAPLAELALETAMRQSELLSLTSAAVASCYGNLSHAPQARFFGGIALSDMTGRGGSGVSESLQRRWNTRS